MMVWDTTGHVVDKMGYAGAYVGYMGGKIYALGGANFPSGTPPWKGGEKVWSRRIFIFDADGNSQEASFMLPKPMGYGAYASYQDRLYIAGGSDQSGHLTDVYMLQVSTGGAVFTQLPDLPAPIANCASVSIGDYWYILGGIQAPDAKEATTTCWRMDLKDPDKGWEILTGIPGPGRMLAVAGNADGNLVVVSGVQLINGHRKYLKDAYLLDQHGVWQRLPDLQDAVAAAPSPAAIDQKSGRLLIFGGDDGSLANAALEDEHPGFSNKILSYHIMDRKWGNAGEIPVHKGGDAASNPGASVWSPVTTGTVQYGNMIFIPMGEVRPGIRTSRILTVCLSQ